MGCANQAAAVGSGQLERGSGHGHQRGNRRGAEHAKEESGPEEPQGRGARKGEERAGGAGAGRTMGRQSWSPEALEKSWLRRLTGVGGRVMMTAVKLLGTRGRWYSYLGGGYAPSRHG